MFAEKLKKLRKKYDLSQEQLAEEINLSASTIGMYETGKRKPDSNNLSRIADYFDCSIDYLLNRQKENNFIKEFELVPVLGRVSAGQPLFSKENIIDHRKVPAEEIKDGQYFYLEVKGESMAGAGIHEGYCLLVRTQQTIQNGDIAVVMLNGEQTVKRIYKTDHQLVLEPENPQFEPIVVKNQDIDIIGKVVVWSPCRVGSNPTFSTIYLTGFIACFNFLFLNLSCA